MIIVNNHIKILIQVLIINSMLIKIYQITKKKLMFSLIKKLIKFYQMMNQN